GPPWLAHVASKEGIVAVEHLCGNSPAPMRYDNVPGCTYCEPQVSSVGLTEKQATEDGYEIKVGKFPFRALGKAMAIDKTEGFVKVIYDKKYGELLGCHIIGAEATDLISEVGIARTLETTWHEVLDTIHPHPTLSEVIMEATADAFGEAIHK
ncbi:MAG: dihydrolipoyl dehydrogenase, partial [Fidelibacterota bacterium]